MNGKQKTISGLAALVIGLAGMLATSTGAMGIMAGPGGLSCTEGNSPRLSTTRSAHGIPIYTDHVWNNGTARRSTAQTFVSAYFPSRSANWYALSAAESWISIKPGCARTPV